MDPDPFLADQDALRLYGADEIIISTLPYPRSGLLRRDLIERIRELREDPGRARRWSTSPTEPIKHTLVVANQTVGGRPLIETLERALDRVAAPLHRHRAAGRRRAARPPRPRRSGSSSTLEELRQAGPRRDRLRRRTPTRSRAIVNAHPVRPRRRDRHLDAAELPVELAARRPDRTASGARPACRSST